MRSLKKYITILVVLSLIIACLSGCGANNGANTANNTEPKEPVTVRIGSLTGPTTIGLVKLLSDAEESKTENKYVSTIAGSADELTPLMIKGELDVLVAPSNLASVLYNKTEGKIQMAAVTTLGVLSIFAADMPRDLINTPYDWNELKGNTIYATGKGSTPEYNLRYLLTKHGIDPDKDVNIEFKSEPAEILALYESSDHQKGFFFMLPQPYASVVSAKYPELAKIFDLSEEWDKLGEDSKMITACIMVRKEFAEQNPEAVDTLLKEYAASAEWVNANVDEAAALVEKYIGTKAAIAKKAIPLCNIVSITGSEMKKAVEAYYKVLFGFNPASIGGKLPADDFWYGAK